jgi:hypothetical protein
LGTASNEATVITQLKSTNFNAYWNGWNANTSVTTGGACIHHPAGDIKKISTFTGNTVSTQWGSASGSHWRVTWTSNSNGHGVTEGGSSGSPLFNGSQGYVIGTLTGGASFCTAPSAPDQYGKMSFHWTNNGTATNRQLKPWLDPNNTGVLEFAGSSNPCSGVGLDEIMNNSINIYPNPTDNELYIDLKNIEDEVKRIEIIDLSGKVLQVIAANQGEIMKMSTANLAQGMYQIRILSDEYTITKRFVKK